MITGQKEEPGVWQRIYIKRLTVDIQLSHRLWRVNRMGTFGRKIVDTDVTFLFQRLFSIKNILFISLLKKLLSDKRIRPFVKRLKQFDLSRTKTFRLHRDFKRLYKFL